MGVQKDSAKLIAELYQNYISDKRGFICIGSTKLIQNGWTEGELRRATKYLEEKGMIDVKYCVGGNFIISGIFPKGIDIVENEDKYKREFSAEAQIPGFLKVIWGVKDR